MLCVRVCVCTCDSGEFSEGKTHHFRGAIGGQQQQDGNLHQREAVFPMNSGIGCHCIDVCARIVHGLRFSEDGTYEERRRIV